MINVSFTSLGKTIGLVLEMFHIHTKDGRAKTTLSGFIKLFLRDLIGPIDHHDY